MASHVADRLARSCQPTPPPMPGRHLPAHAPETSPLHPRPPSLSLHPSKRLHHPDSTHSRPTPPPDASYDDTSTTPHAPSPRRHPRSLAAAPTKTSSPAASHRRATSRRLAKPRAVVPASTPKRGMTGMLDIDRARSRRDRTFAGSKCVICDEPLEHTLRGERILQLACSHVSHEACFYEYIRSSDNQRCPGCDAALGLDSSRGGNVLDIEKLSAIVRSLQVPGVEPAPTRAVQEPSIKRSRSTKTYTPSEKADALAQTHVRPDSAMADNVSAAPSSQIPPMPTKRIDYDALAGDMVAASMQHGNVKSPIPPPTLIVRSEYPTITRSRGQQSLTCLVTVEVPEGKWKPDPEDFRGFAINSADLDEAIADPALSVDESAAMTDDIVEPYEDLEHTTNDLLSRVDNWHGLDFSRFGKLKLHGTFYVGKDKLSWQELECYLFAEMLICVKEKRNAQPTWDGEESIKGPFKCTLKGSIMIKRHLNRLEESPGDDCVLTLNLSVVELPAFHLRFPNRKQLELWKRALITLNTKEASEKVSSLGSVPDDDEYRHSRPKLSSVNSSYGGAQSVTNATTDYSEGRSLVRDSELTTPSLHVPVDVVIVVPISSSMHGLKITLLRDMLRFLISNLGDRDRIGLVAFGSNNGAIPLVGLETRQWPDWDKVADSIRATGQKSPRADLVEGANAAMDLLMQRRTANPLASIIIVSDSSTSESDSIDFVVSRAEAAKVSIYCFGLGLTHRADAMIELASRTKASYTYVKDWMMLRECVGGCLGSLQTTSHQNVRLKLRLPDGSPAKFVKISGAMQVTKRASGRDAEAALGDMRFGEKRDILVQLAVASESPEGATADGMAQDPWESIVSGLEALGGPVDTDDIRAYSVEEVPMLQADLLYGDILRDGMVAHLPRPSLLAITVLPGPAKPKAGARPSSPPIPPHSSIVQRRMELLTSDMLTRALSLVARGQHERAHHLLRETRSILKGLGKGSLPPLPGAGPATGRASPAPAKSPMLGTSPLLPHQSLSSTVSDTSATPSDLPSVSERAPASPSPAPALAPTVGLGGVDAAVMAALEAELEASLEWIGHPAVFGRDSRKAVLQAIGVISSQRAYTFRTQLESLWAIRVAGTREAIDRSRGWRDAGGGEVLLEEG